MAKTPEDLEEFLDQAFQCFQVADYTGSEKALKNFFDERGPVEQMGSEWLAKANWLKAQLLIQSKAFSEATSFYQKALKNQEATNSKKSFEYLSMLREFGHLHFHWTGNYLMARQLFEEGEALCQELTKFENMDEMLVFELFSDMACTLGDLYEDLDETERASRQFLSQVVFFKKFGNKMEAYLLRPYLRLTQISAERSREEEVESCLREVFNLLDASRATLLFFEALCVSADCYRKCGDHEESELSFRAASRVLERDPDLIESDVYIEYLRVKALLELQNGKQVLAEESLRNSLGRVRSIMGENSLTEAMFHFEWAETLKKLSTKYDPSVEQAYWQALENIDKGLSAEHPRQIRFLSPYSNYLAMHGKKHQAGALLDRKEELIRFALGRSQ